MKPEPWPCCLPDRWLLRRAADGIDHRFEPCRCARPRPTLSDGIQRVSELRAGKRADAGASLNLGLAEGSTLSPGQGWELPGCRPATENRLLPAASKPRRKTALTVAGQRVMAEGGPG